MGQAGGRRLRAARQARGWALDDVAVALHELAADLGEPQPAVDFTQVSKWERGVRNPGKFYRPRLCLVLEATPAALGWLATPRLTRDIRDLARRQAEGRSRPRPSLGPPSEREPGAATFPHVDSERLAAALRYLWPVDEALAAGLERAARYLDWRAEMERPAAVLADLAAFLEVLQTLLVRSQATAARLQSIGARIAHDIAYLEFVQGRIPAAFNAYAVSEALAREAGDDVELATTLVGKNGIYLPHDMAAAVRSTEAAALLLSDRAPSGLVAWVWGERAMQEAEMGHEAAALRFQERMLAVAEADPAGLNLFAPDMRPSWLERRPAVVALKLGRAAEALTTLEDNRTRIDPRLAKEVVLNGVDLASAWAMRGEVEAACELLTEAATLAVGEGFRRGVELAGRVRDQQMGRWRHVQCVRDLGEQLRGVR